MKKLNFWLLASLFVGAMAFTACSSSNDGEEQKPPTDSPSIVGKGVLKPLDESVLGSWDQGWATDDGTFLIKGNVGTKSRAEATSLNTQTLYFSSRDAAVKATLLISSEDKRPLQFIMKEGILKFSFLNDKVLELLFQKGSEIHGSDKPVNR